MIYVIFPTDPTTQFLEKVVADLQVGLGGELVYVIKVDASDMSYKKAKEEIALIPEKAVTLFMGHGTAQSLYGGTSPEYPEKELFRLGDTVALRNKHLFLLSCFSASFLHSTRRDRNYINSVGFGMLPTEMGEVAKFSRLRKQAVEQPLIEEYKDILVESVASSIVYSFQRDCSLDTIYYHFRLLINRKISDLVINQGNRVLADVLYQMRLEMVFD